MRKLFFALSALAALSLLAPSSGFAQANNQMGLYMVVDDYTTVSFAGPDVLFSLYLVVHYPYLEESNYGAVGPAGQIAGFEFIIDIPAAVTLMGFELSAEGRNLGALPEVLAAFGNPIDVVDNHCYLGYFDFFCMALPENEGICLTPLTNSPSIPGELAIAIPVDEDIDELQPVWPSSSSHSSPVFMFNGTPTDAQSETWGGVKSLYR